MEQRGARTLLAAILLPVVVIGGYAFVTGIGLLWPEWPMVAIISSIVVSILLWLGSALWFQRRTGWWRSISMVVFAGCFVFPMVGAATLGTDLAIERQSEQVTGEVVDIEFEQTNRREGREAWKTTYTFVATEDRRELGSIDYRGSKNGDDLAIGDRVELLADPSGELPLKLAEKVDISTTIGMFVIGGFLFTIAYLCGLFWPPLRRALGIRGSGIPDPWR